MAPVVTIYQQTTDTKLDRFFMDRHPQQNGDYEVHRGNCPFRSSDAKDLGYHQYGYTAMIEARKVHPIANGCLHCCCEIHRG